MNISQRMIKVICWVAGVAAILLLAGYVMIRRDAAIEKTLEPLMALIAIVTIVMSWTLPKALASDKLAKRWGLVWLGLVAVCFVAWRMRGFSSTESNWLYWAFMTIWLGSETVRIFQFFRKRQGVVK